MLNSAGIMLEKWYNELQHKFTGIAAAEFVIMPNHFHAIIVNIADTPVGADLCVCPGSDVCPGTREPAKQSEHVKTQGGHTGPPLHAVIQWFKTMTTNEYIRGVKNHGWQPFSGKLWQRNYYEHIIRNEHDYNRVAEYIINNPKTWKDDKLWIN